MVRLASTRSRLALLFSALLLLSLTAGAYAATKLIGIENEERARDQWQRPDAVLRALDLKDGSVVVDLGSGSGYFALKLASAVGADGKVIAVDIRRMSLLKLWVRAILENRHNIDLVLGQPDDPRLGSEAVDAVLIAYAYHELTNPGVILERLGRSLRRGGRLVVLDLSPRAPGADSRKVEEQHHELSVSFAESDLRQRGFELASVQNRFTDSPDKQTWWLIVARRK